MGGILLGYIPLLIIETHPFKHSFNWLLAMLPNNVYFYGSIAVFVLPYGDGFFSPVYIWVD